MKRVQTIPLKKWKELQSMVLLLTEESSSSEVLGIILNWLKSDSQFFLFEPFSRYGFDYFITLDSDEFCLEFSELKGKAIDHFKQCILEYSAKDVERITIFLRDSIEELCVYQADEECPNCAFGAMQVIEGITTGQLAYQCRVCGYGQYLSGERTNRNEKFKFVSKFRLKREGFI